MSSNAAIDPASHIQSLEAELARLQAENESLKKSQQDLASARNKFVDLFDFAPLGYVILSPSAEILEANAFAAQLVGLNRSQLLGDNLTKYIHPDDQTQFEAFLLQTCSSSEPCIYKTRLSAEKILDVSLQARYLAGYDGQIFMTISDITFSNQIKAERTQLLAEKNEAMRKLEHTRAMLDALFEEAPVGLAFLDEDLHYQKLNRALADTNGLSIEAHLGKTPSELLPDLPPEVTSEYFEVVKQTGKPVPFQTEGKTPLDPKITRSWWGVYYPIHLHGQLWGIGMIVIENTAQKQAEIALQKTRDNFRKNEERFKLALQNTDVTLFNQDRDLRYTWIYNNILLTEPEDFLGKTDDDLWEPEQAAILTQLKQAVLATGEEKREEIQMVVDGKIYYFNCIFAPQYEDDEIVGIIGVSFDLTPQKETALEMYRQRLLAEALSDAVSAAHGSINLTEVLDYILGSMANVIPHDIAEILLIEGIYVTKQRSRGYSQLNLDVNHIFPVEKPFWEIPLLAEMYHSRTPQLIPDLQNCPEEPTVTIDGLHSYVGVPLLWQNEVIGFMNVASRSYKAFNPQHAEKMTIFAAQTALAIRNAQLYEEAQQIAILEERQRLARDLHDAVSQSLYTSNIIAETLQVIYKTNPSQLPDHLEKLRVLNRGALAEMRTLLLELRPEKLEATSMPELLEQLADATEARMGIRSKVSVKSDETIPLVLKEALYRITQEALTNIIKHAQASNVHIRYSSKNVKVKLVIEDDGKGFDIKDAAINRMGITNMRERMAHVGGNLEIDSEIDGGTVLTIMWSST